MPRIFASLALAQLLLTAMAGGLGLAHLDPEADRHTLLAVLALLLGCLIQVVAVTYLSVSGKMLAQASHFGGLGLDAVHRFASLKRRLMRWLAVATVLLVVLAATGGYHWRTRAIATGHLLIACAALAGHLLAYAKQYVVLKEASSTLEGVLDAYRRARGIGAKAAGDSLMEDDLISTD